MKTILFVEQTMNKYNRIDLRIIFYKKAPELLTYLVICVIISNRNDAKNSTKCITSERDRDHV